MAYTTVQDFTNGEQKELSYGMVGPYIMELRDLLSKSGIDIYNKYTYDNIYEYDEGLEQAIIEFKTSQGLTNPDSGIVDNNTLNALFAVSNIMSDTVESDYEEDETVDTSSNSDPRYDSFFSKDNTKEVRKNNNDINIVLGNNNVVKTIHNVYMRSVSTEVDTSGNPISETYEFIAQDLTESDESKDANKYE